MSEVGETPSSHGYGFADGGVAGEDHERVRVVREALLGQTIAGRYTVRALVGHGGMGAVYEAEHVGLGKRVAIKFIDQEFATDERVVARFAREARAMSAIESAHIVTVFDAGTEGGRPYLVMELLRGEDLGQRLRRTRRVPLPEAMHIVAQVLKGLARAHAAGVVHRDLKPDNIFIVNSDTDPSFAKIVDFGVSKIERPREKTSPLALTGRGTVLGTPFYMCPEQAQAMPDVDARADVYSVGAILFECLSGRPPHTGETYEQIILSICMRDAPDVRAIDPRIPADVANFVARALSRERVDRFPSAERMLAMLHEIAPEEKRRVPLDGGVAETLLSAGMLPVHFERQSAPRPVMGSETRIAGSGSSASDPGAPCSSMPFHPAAPAVPASRRSSEVDGSASERSIGAATEAALSAAGLESRSKRSIMTIVATGAIAMLLGIVMMLAIIGLLDKKSTETLAEPTPTTPAFLAPTTIATEPPAAGMESASPAELSAVPEVPQVPARAPRSRSKSTRSGGEKAMPAKSLDIARELP